MAYNIYDTGTVDVTAGGTVVSGDGVYWAGQNARAGDLFVIGATSVVIIDVTDSETLLIPEWPGSTETGADYYIVPQSLSRVIGRAAYGDLQRLISAMNADGFIHFVPADLTEPDPADGYEGQFAQKLPAGDTWVKVGDEWDYQGIYKGLSPRGAWDSGTEYTVGDIVSSGGSSYIARTTNTNKTPASNPSDWQVAASKGDTGNTGATGASYAATSATSLAISVATKTFTTQAGLAYVVGSRVRMASAANTANYMEGRVTAYSGTSMTISVDRTAGSGTFADWNLSITGDPSAGSGDAVGPSSATDNAIARFDSTTGKLLQDSTTTVDDSGKIGVARSSASAFVHIGAGAGTANDPTILLTRDLTGSSGNGHGITDASNINRSGTIGYAAFDAATTWSGSNNYDHYVGFQAAPVYGSSGTMANLYGSYTVTTVNAGTITNNYGHYAANPTGAGTITNSYGFYAETQTKGSGQNWGYYAPGPTSGVGVNAAWFAGISIGSSGGDYPSFGYNIKFLATDGTHSRVLADTAAAIRFGASGGKIQTFTAGSSTAGSSISFTAGPEVVSGATAWSAPSDVRLKDDIRSIPPVLDRMAAFRAVSYKLKSSGQSEIGVIAQELLGCFPEVVNQGETPDDMMSVQYERLAVVALQAVKELAVRVDELERAIT